jgi:hypothetical protein
MTFRPCPKPEATQPKPRKWLPKNRTPIARKTFLPRSTTRIPSMNRRATERRQRHYRKVIGSAFNKELRYKAYLRSKGLCECDECREIRKVLTTNYMKGQSYSTEWETERVALAFAEIPCWFVKSGGEPWRRFRSRDGETHHTGYRLFGDENPAEIDLVQFAWKQCHQRIESEHGTRRRFLKGK